MDTALKNMYNPQLVAVLAAAVQRAYPAFDREAFMDRVFDEEWDGQELKQRMRHITVKGGWILVRPSRSAAIIVSGR
jgi:3-methyladenine DNA glycosylase AlkC